MIAVIMRIIGGVLALFIDDAVTKWLKNAYWGTSHSYLYWKDISRSALSEAMQDLPQGHRSQVESIQRQDPEFYEPRFMERELQEFHQIIYWPRNARASGSADCHPRQGVRFLQANNDPYGKRGKILLGQFSSGQLYRRPVPV
ncbi:hypothetical protein JMK10_20745 [Rhodovulum sulfidophilum]|uniref:hypothetical protein n=1 Tax=Rhodovulum sulfidophilum TaxID=35806 RepID=UPI001921F64F|nr:hypothetical protein [Rhodovulum sulfidophilum]MBL3575840.1 hypothetical protein [Rhodovulum sulfidophilum]MCF4119110.1 hypothetical protein [Rhodovulum sulfidophilum]